MDHGRPSKYDDKFCDEVITFMSYGKSFEAFAGHKGVSKSTLYNWVAAHPEFQAAKEIANSK